VPTTSQLVRSPHSSFGWLCGLIELFVLRSSLGSLSSSLSLWVRLGSSLGSLSLALSLALSFALSLALSLAVPLAASFWFVACFVVVRRSSFVVLHSWFIVRCSSFCIRGSSCVVRRCLRRCSAFSSQHSRCGIVNDDNGTSLQTRPTAVVCVWR